MSAPDLEVGRVYQPRKGARSAPREIIWMSSDGERVQYDGPAVKAGRRYPCVTAAAFRKWAGLSDG